MAEEARTVDFQAGGSNPHYGRIALQLSVQELFDSLIIRPQPPDQGHSAD